ncbi:MAG TPA: hypothetical protein DCY61_01735 [Dehalococcoidia bacterium]|nr:hypothetical protein [Dehalococcoidia bacterium]
METAIVAVVCIALVMFGALTMLQTSLSSVDLVNEAWREREQTTQEIAMTDISSLSTNVTDAGAIVEMTLKNEGESKLKDFGRWDVIVQYRDTATTLLIKRLLYVEGEPGNDQWTVKGIYLDAATRNPEVFESGILNPDEEMIIRMRLNPPVGVGTTNRATIATPNGVSTSATFTR